MILDRDEHDLSRSGHHAAGRDVFVSSANFTEAAQERNVEVGILLHSATVAMRLTHFFDVLCETGLFLRAM